MAMVETTVTAERLWFWHEDPATGKSGWRQQGGAFGNPPPGDTVLVCWNDIKLALGKPRVQSAEAA